MKISTKLFFYVSILLVLTSIGLGYISVRDERIHLMNETQNQARALANTLSATFKYYHMEDHHERIGEIIHAIMPHDQNVSNMLINIYDQQGQLMNLSFAHGKSNLTPSKQKEISEVITGTSEQLIRKGSLEYFSVSSPIINSLGEFQGLVEVMLSLAQINEKLTGIIRKFVVFIILTASLLGVLIYLISRWSISQPISNLKDAAEKLGHGDLGLRLKKSGVAELDDLIVEFNRMAQNLERQNLKREELFSEKLNLERRLRHADKLASIGQLASGLAHEIGTPLNVISGRAEQLLQKMTNEPLGGGSLKNIIRQSERITKIIQKLLDFSRKPIPLFTKIDLEKIIQDAFSMCKLKQRKQHPQIEIELDIEQKSLMADEDSMRQLFVNLLLNSFDAMSNGGKITISNTVYDLDSNEVVIFYQDNGPGIPVETKDRVFDPFFTTKDVGEGTGLGLFIVSSIVQEHQGRIELDSNFDEGAKFVIHFPLSLNQAPRHKTNI